MNCPSCGSENRDDAKFCNRCGQALDARQEASSALNVPSGSTDSAKTVIAGGAPPAQNPPPAPASPPSVGGQKTVIAGGGAPAAQPATTPAPATSGGGAKTVIANPGNDTGTDPIGTANPVSSPAQSGSGNMGGTVIMNPSASVENSMPQRVLVGWLVTFSSFPNGQDYRLYEGRNIIGKEPGCDIILSDNAVSGKHAMIMFRSGQYAVIDQDSTNGSWVNGDDIGIGGRAELNDNDILKLGDTTCVFKCFDRPKE